MEGCPCRRDARPFISSSHFWKRREKQNEKDYGFEIEYERAKKLKCTFLPGGKQGIRELKQIIENVEKYDFVELPPIDSIREVIYSAYIIYKCRKKNVKTGYFW